MGGRTEGGRERGRGRGVRQICAKKQSSTSIQHGSFPFGSVPFRSVFFSFFFPLRFVFRDFLLLFVSYSSSVFRPSRLKRVVSLGFVPFRFVEFCSVSTRIRSGPVRSVVPWCRPFMFLAPFHSVSFRFSGRRETIVWHEARHPRLEETRRRQQGKS